MIEQFVHLVRQYLALVDNLPGAGARDFLMQCGILLPQLYSLVVQLPDVELPDDPGLEDGLGQIQLPKDGIEPPMGRIVAVLKEYDLYYEVFDPVSDREAITTTLSNDLSDIYVDLKRPLVEYDSGEDASQRSAIWDWKFTHQIHWGHHLVGALRPIHRLVYDHLAPDDDDEEDGS